MTKFYSVLTNYGVTAFAQAISTKQPLNILKMAVGDGNGRAVTPDSSRTALVREVYRANISSIKLDVRNNKQVIFELTIPEDVGGFYIREMGIFDHNEKLVAIANTPESYKPQLTEGSGKVQVLRMILLVSSSDSVSLTVDNSLIWAKRSELTPKDLDENSQSIIEENGHSHRLPIATLLKKGITKLFSGLDSDAEDMAATPKAIKALKSLIDAITRNLGNYIPNSKKSNAVDSNSADTVATSVAVKTAYDKGVEARTAVDNLDSVAYKVNKSAGYAGNAPALMRENTVFSTTDSNLLGLPSEAYPFGSGLSMSTGGGKALIYVAHDGSQVWAKGGYGEDYSQPWKRLDGADWENLRDPPSSVNHYGFSDFDIKYLGPENLNDMSKFGLYGQANDINATPDRSYPIQEAGTLVVTPSAYGVQQEYTTYNANQKYVRGKIGNHWQPWKRIDGLNKEDALVEHHLDLTSLDQSRWYPVLMQMPSARRLYRFALYHALYEESRPSWGLHEGGFGVRCEWEVMPSAWGTWNWSGFRLVKHFEYAHCNQSPLLNLGQIGQESKEYVYLRGGAKYRLYCEPDVRVEISRSDYHGASADGQHRWYIPMLHTYDTALLPKPLRVQLDDIHTALNNKANKADTLLGYGIKDFVLQRKETNDDANLLNKDGIYSFDDGGVNMPSPTPYKILNVLGGEGYWGHQLAFNAYANKMFIRAIEVTNGNWLPWTRILLENDFTQLLSETGWQRLPSGLILQWGTFNNISTDGDRLLHFPIVFPNQCVGVVPTKIVSPRKSTVENVQINGYEQGGFYAATAQIGRSFISMDTLTFSYFAVGF